ncbi:unnamed protein product [Trifolium pratense]|uniref:Uncharacterized protein n=1 Tax=Trifolium pratense TaxID=57577 RepID=A0ACB0J841_TRIPR|nr:unnamed protein product [Trifolium pratense]
MIFIILHIKIENMAKILKFMYVMILSFFLFLVAKRVDCGYTNLINKPVPCNTRDDCPQIWTRKYHCINNECVVYSISTIRL